MRIRRCARSLNRGLSLSTVLFACVLQACEAYHVVRRPASGMATTTTTTFGAQQHQHGLAHQGLESVAAALESTLFDELARTIVVLLSISEDLPVKEAIIFCIPLVIDLFGHDIDAMLALGMVMLATALTSELKVKDFADLTAKK